MNGLTEDYRPGSPAPCPAAGRQGRCVPIPPTQPGHAGGEEGMSTCVQTWGLPADPRHLQLLYGQPVREAGAPDLCDVVGA